MPQVIGYPCGFYNTYNSYNNTTLPQTNRLVTQPQVYRIASHGAKALDE